MRIGIVSPYYMDRFGGVQTLILATKKELESKGHEVKIIAPKPRDLLRVTNTHADVELLGHSAEIKMKAPFHTTFPVAISVDNKEIDLMLEKYDFDVLHVHEPWLPMLAYQIVQRAKCPVVGTLHAKWPETFVNKSIEKAIIPYVKSAAKKLDYITAVSNVAGDYAHEVITKEIQIIPNGIELDFFHRENVHRIAEYKNEKTILFVNRLEKRKGCIYLLRAFKELSERRDGIRLLIAGSGPRERALQAYVKKYSIKNVEFLGYISDEEKRRLLKTASIYCAPAPYGESFGIVLLEAMAMGAVTVAGNNPGYSAVMEDRGKISLIDPKDTEEFADRLELLLYDKDLRKLWKDWAKEYVKKYDFKNISAQYEELFKKAVKNGKI